MELGELFEFFQRKSVYMSSLENFINKPVILQLVDPIVAVHSVEQAAFNDPETDAPIPCGKAGITMRQTTEGQPQPVLMQVLSGEVVAFDEHGVVFSTLGGDSKTDVLQYIERRSIRCMSFAINHPEEAKLVTL